jgi:hypothetical protein
MLLDSEACQEKLFSFDPHSGSTTVVYPRHDASSRIVLGNEDGSALHEKSSRWISGQLHL